VYTDSSQVTIEHPSAHFIQNPDYPNIPRKSNIPLLKDEIKAFLGVQSAQMLNKWNPL